MVALTFDVSSDAPADSFEPADGHFAKLRNTLENSNESTTAKKLNEAALKWHDALVPICR